MLQRELPEGLRHQIVNKLFQKYVGVEETIFSKELYMNVDQLRCMLRHNMYIGCHGYGHYWLNTLPREQQEEEIDKSLDFLCSIGCDMNNWIMNYPYGAYNESLIDIIRKRGCKLALSTQVEIADRRSNMFALPRLDANDIPKDRYAVFHFSGEW